MLGLLHPLGRGLDGVDSRLDSPRRRHLPRRLGLGRQPRAPALLEGAAVQGWSRFRSRQLHARGRCIRRHDQVGRQDTPRRQDGRPRCRPPGRRGIHLVQGEGRGEGARPLRRRLRHVAGLAALGLDPVSEREQLGPGQRRLHAGRRGRRGLESHRPHRRRRARHRSGPPHPARRRRGGLAVRRPGRSVRHDDQLVAHVPELGADQRIQPVQRVHAPRRLGLQPRVAEPDEVPPRGRRVRRRGLPARRRHGLPRTGDHRRLLELPDARDRAQRTGLPRARPRLREPGRAADGSWAPLRLATRVARTPPPSPRS